MITAKDRHRSRVLTVGPDLTRHCGLATLMRTYRKYVPDFTYIPICNHYGRLRSAWMYLRTALRLPVMRLKGYGVLHFHVNASMDIDRVELLRKWGATLGFKTIYHSHDFMRLDEALRSDKASKIRKILAAFDAHVAVSEKLKTHLEQRGGCSDVYVVPNMACPIDKLRNRSKRRKDEPLRLLYLGALTEEKGIFDLIEALRDFVDYETQLQLTVAGDGQYDAVNDAVADAGLDKIVRFMGWVEGNERDRLLRLNDIMVIPSHDETLPMPLIEAAVYAMPVITTNPEMIEEYFKEDVTGLSVSKGCPEEIADAIRYYLENPDDIPRHGFGGAVQMEVCMPEHVLEALENVYASISEQ